mmetsp:Transcript_8097/g.16107  ORF Transcript_8097/g.16107 Transcript_8097/m.16107 type:complete len:208 (+) Transcript_8097:288-911(+)
MSRNEDCSICLEKIENRWRRRKCKQKTCLICCIKIVKFEDRGSRGRKSIKYLHSCPFCRNVTKWLRENFYYHFYLSGLPSITNKGVRSSSGDSRTLSRVEGQPLKPKISFKKSRRRLSAALSNPVDGPSTFREFMRGHLEEEMLLRRILDEQMLRWRRYEEQTLMRPRNALDQRSQQEERLAHMMQVIEQLTTEINSRSGQDTNEPS